ncbi:MAG: GTP pyrophosphokinase, partial [Christensenellaceae bacterium]
ISTCAALLHDVVEDTAVTIEELEQEFPKEVTGVLRLLTHEKGTDYFDYVRAIKGNPVAVKVKLADLAHNSDETRFAGCDEIPAEQLVKWREKYARARRILEDGKD